VVETAILKRVSHWLDFLSSVSEALIVADKLTLVSGNYSVL
jgi:hypothetical protein